MIEIFWANIWKSSQVENIWWSPSFMRHCFFEFFTIKLANFFLYDECFQVLAASVSWILSTGSRDALEGGSGERWTLRDRKPGAWDGRPSQGDFRLLGAALVLETRRPSEKILYWIPLYLKLQFIFCTIHPLDGSSWLKTFSMNGCRVTGSKTRFPTPNEPLVIHGVKHLFPACYFCFLAESDLSFRYS